MREYLFEKPQEPLLVGNTLWETIEKNPTAPWDFWELSWHPELPWKFINQNIDRSWNWALLSERPDIDFEVIRSHTNKPWDWRRISNNPAISLETIEQYPDYFWSFDKRKVPFGILRKIPSYQSVVRAASGHISLDEILDNLDFPWDWNQISSRSDISMKYVQDHIQLPWNFHLLSQKKDIDWELVEKYIHNSWDFGTLSKRKGIPLRLVAAHPTKWDIKTVFHVNKYWELVDLFPAMNWNFRKMDDAPWWLITKFPYACWYWRSLSIREDLPIPFLRTHVDLEWSWDKLSLNPSITAEFVYHHRWYPWNWHIIKKRMASEIAAIRIQRWWLRLYYDPSSHICYQRLLRDCAMLNAISVKS